MIKTIIKHLLFGIAGGCVICISAIIFWDLTDSDILYAFFENVTVYALGNIAMSVGFAMSAIVYEIDRLALWMKISINVFVGFGIFFFVGLNTGMISLGEPVNIIISIVAAAVVFIIVYFVGYLFSKGEAKRINERLRELDTEK